MAFSWQDFLVTVFFLGGWYYFWETAIDLSWRLFGPTIVYLLFELEGEQHDVER